MRKKVIVTCNGCFDGLHQGHLFFLGYCRALGDTLIVGVNSDEYILKRKRVPIPQDERVSELRRIGCIDRIVTFKEDDPREFIKKYKPDIHCIGEEYIGTAIEIELCREMGIKIVFVPRVGDWSSTKIRG
jgi:D-beta-D-heptose 7-phosphate kinase/D-beta-D-heptose 1-phosphate adenosyltransferase